MAKQWTPEQKKRFYFIKLARKKKAHRLEMEKLKLTWKPHLWLRPREDDGLEPA